MKRPTCLDCRHCKVRQVPDSHAGPLVFCDKDAWPRLGSTEAYGRLHGSGGRALATRLADGCLHYEDMAG